MDKCQLFNYSANSCDIFETEFWELEGKYSEGSAYIKCK